MSQTAPTYQAIRAAERFLGCRYVGVGDCVTRMADVLDAYARAAIAEHEIRRRLAAYYTPAETDQWLTEAHQLLGGRVALEVIYDGRAAEVDAVIDRIDDGDYL